MATDTLTPYNNTKSLISFLAEDDEDSQVYALTNLAENIDYLWHELIDHIEHLIGLQANPSFPEQSLINFVLAKIFYHKEDYENALNYILLAKNHFDINERTEFIDKMLSKALDRYSQIQQHNYSSQENDKIVVDENLLNLVNHSFKLSMEKKMDRNIVAGLAIEARRLDIVQQVIDKTENLSVLLNHLFYISQNHVQSKLFKDALINLILQAYASTGKQGQDAWNVCHCYLHLGMPAETAKVIVDLICENKEKSTLLALQISSDIQEAENQFFSDNLLAEIEKLPIESQGAVTSKLKVVKVLSGEFANETSYKFLSQNNRANKDIITQLRKYWDKKNSTYHNAVINAYAILHAGTLDDTYLAEDENKQWASKNNNWSKFTSIACLGTIHKRNPKIQEKLGQFLPGGAGASQPDWVQGGAMYALGLAKTATKKPEDIQFLTDQIERDANINPDNEADDDLEGVIHGACLGLGLIGMSTYDIVLVERLKGYLFRECATKGEAAAYGIGLIMCGKMDQEFVQELFHIARENKHEKIIRGISVALAMMCYEHEEEADAFIDQMITEKDSIIRYGGVFAIGMAYVGTGNNKALRKLLHIAASDVVDDVRRGAVTAIGFVMLNNYKKVPKIISLLADSYNPHVRYGATIAIGISCANTNSAEAIKLLQQLEDDNTDFVKQGSVIAQALVLQQATDKHDRHVEPFREKLNARLKKKKGAYTHKFGCILALGLLESGGKNSVVKLRSESGTMKRGSVMGMLLFTQHWYWFPLIQMISLCLEPTFLMGVNKDLKIPTGFQFKSNVKKSIFDYPPIDTNSVKKEEKKVKVVLSTTKRAEAKKAIKKGGMDEEKIPGQEDTQTEETQAKTEDVTATEDAEKKPEEKEGKMEEEKPKEPEEAPTCLLNNPSRVLRIQEKTIEYLHENRYEAILENRKRGYVFLFDTSPEEPEKYIDEQPLEAWLIPPPDFYFKEDLQDN